MANELKELVKNKPNQYFSFNIDPQQLLYPSTIEALKALIPYQKTLMVEITEAIPSKRYFDQYYNNSMIEPIKQVHDLGFRIAIDDVSSGMNSFNIVREYGKYIDRIKLSLLQLRNVSKDLVQETVMLWRSMAI
ncbi:EAL domain-containing protein, partial [Streptomyces sp. S9]|nr:EAL domain-containing protein [Streptomyces sp. S9]